MSVVVRMEMPENCAVCPFVTEYSRCVFLGMFAIDEERRADKCPILCSLPEGHGRLVDADEFLKRAIGTKCFDEDDSRMLTELVGESITIVPAEAERSETCLD